MPTVAVIFGLVIQLYYGDHDPPHIHVRGPDFRCKIELDGLTVLEVRGKLRSRDLARVRAWMSRHRRELAHAWAVAQSGEPPPRIGGS
jgi:hypothetical protein